MREEQAFEGWVVLELMGHRKLGGYLREQTVGGAAFLRIDIKDRDDEPVASQFYAPAAVYCITPVTEDIARGIARRTFTEPVSRWEMPTQLVEGRAEANEDEDDERDFFGVGDPRNGA